MIATSQYNLITTIVNREYPEQVMKVAKLGGAVGGIIVSAREAGIHGTEKILGFSIHLEEEVVLILILREKKQGIMRAICQRCGLCTETHDISIAVPAEDAMGLPVADMERELHVQELRKAGT